MAKYLIRYRTDYGVFYIPIYEVSAQEAANRFRKMYSDQAAFGDVVIEAVFVETGLWV